VFAFRSNLPCLAANFAVRNLDTIRRIWVSAAVLCLFCFTSHAAEQKLVKISSHKEDAETEFYVENLQNADVTVTIEMELANLTSAETLPYTATIPPRSKVKMFSVSPSDTSRDSSWSYTYYATWGNLNVTHDDTYIYHLPYRPGEAFPVSQGFHGKYSHTGGDSFSIDFKMPEGTPVLAAREGVVVGIKDDSDTGGSDKKFEWDANYVLVKHSDGTLGHYVHLKKDGVRVKLGQTVSAGEVIALSGNTGHSTGPHLHFAVFRAQSGKQRETFPIKYRVTPLMADILSEGRSYRAF
jgi:murein DD-endopeptidase MepM/ murein hydrolase activator NlpD